MIVNYKIEYYAHERRVCERIHGEVGVDLAVGYIEAELQHTTENIYDYRRGRNGAYYNKKSVIPLVLHPKRLPQIQHISHLHKTQENMVHNSDGVDKRRVEYVGNEQNIVNNTCYRAEKDSEHHGHHYPVAAALLHPVKSKHKPNSKTKRYNSYIAHRRITRLIKIRRIHKSTSESRNSG